MIILYAVGFAVGLYIGLKMPLDRMGKWGCLWIVFLLGLLAVVLM